MKNIIYIIIIVFITINNTNLLAAPAMINLVFDSSGSVSISDFELANEVASEFAELLYKRSQLKIGERSDWLSVNWFGGAKRSSDYEITPFINCSDINQMGNLSRKLQGKKHPQYGYTAIYNAILLGSAQVIQKDMSIPGDYLKTVIIVTDGEDNDSDSNAKALVNKIFPNNNLLLFVVGVGKGARIDTFKQYAVDVLKIDSFNELLASLTLLLEILP
ncbi:von Willebrand factor, type A domain protein [Candidatus Magnetomorum sp. HK-1]|nr:von Willebrand factor, type A domain protein [Candidatus Magnetomorum sp. HK-1]